MQRGFLRWPVAIERAGRACARRRGYASSSLRPVRGMQDIFGCEMKRMSHIIRVAGALAASYGFQRIETPIVEAEAVFSRTLGDDSDVVSKEMYTFEDRACNRLVLRPECTAGVVRCFINHRYSIPNKVYYCGPAFRYERPQRGRRRQFHQFGIEQLGTEHVLSDVHAMEMAAVLLDRLRIEGVILELNSLGDEETRQQYRRALEVYFSKYDKVLSKTSLERLGRGSVLRILDSKEEEDRVVVAGAPEVTAHMTVTSRKRFDRVIEGLEAAQIPYRLNPRLVRGLDYYNDTCFELVDTSGSALIAGGRYDSLAERMGNIPMPGIGWAAGVDRMVDCLSTSTLETTVRPFAVIAVSEAPSDELDLVRRNALLFAQGLRRAGVSTVFEGSKSTTRQFRTAAKENSKWGVIIGSRELNDGTVLLKDMDSGEERLESVENVMALARRSIITPIESIF